MVTAKVAWKAGHQMEGPGHPEQSEAGPGVVTAMVTIRPQDFGFSRASISALAIFKSSSSTML